jgi:hypothetical protein
VVESFVIVRSFDYDYILAFCKLQHG